MKVLKTLSKKQDPDLISIQKQRNEYGVFKGYRIKCTWIGADNDLVVAYDATHEYTRVLGDTTRIPNHVPGTHIYWDRDLYTPDKSLPKAVIFDIDGTLADKGDRSPYDWDNVGQDTARPSVLVALIAYMNLGYKIIIFTGRDGVCRKQTKKRLNDHEIFYDYFDMREEGDNRKDCTVKKEMLNRIKDEYNVTAVFDDRDQVVKMRRSLGLPCFQVADGNF